MKKLFVTVVIFGLTGAVNAQSAFEGFYGQLSTGYESNTINNTDITVNQSAVGIRPARTLEDRNGGSASSTNMPILLGLGYTFVASPSFTVGIGIDYSFLSTTTDTIQFTTANLPSRANKAYYKIQDRYSIHLSPGYIIDKNKLAYFKVGYANQKLSAYDGSSGNAEGNTNMNGFVFGLGYKQMISSGFYLFSEANYYQFSNTNLSGTGPTTGVRTGGTFNQTSSPGANAYNFLVGVGYRF